MSRYCWIGKNFYVSKFTLFLLSLCSESPINAKDGNSMTPLMRAAANGHEEVINVGIRSVHDLEYILIWSCITLFCRVLPKNIRCL